MRLHSIPFTNNHLGGFVDSVAMLHYAMNGFSSKWQCVGLSLQQLVWLSLALLLLLQHLRTFSYAISYTLSTLPKPAIGSLSWNVMIGIGSVQSALGVLFLFICNTAVRLFFPMLSLSSAFQPSWNLSSTPLPLMGFPSLWTVGRRVALVLIGLTLLNTTLVRFASRTYVVSTLLLVKAWSNGWYMMLMDVNASSSFQGTMYPKPPFAFLALSLVSCCQR